jgi:uncharacterized protein (TIGR02284 family)
MKHARNDHEAAALQEILIRLADSIAGLRLAADFSTEADFIRLCERTADQREGLAEELAAIIASCGTEPALDGSKEASVHRAWIRFVCQIHPKFRLTLRSECERGERQFRRTLDLRQASATRSERTGMLLADLRHSVNTTLVLLRRVEAARQSAPHLAAA